MGRDLFSTPLMGGCVDLDDWAPMDKYVRSCLNRFHGREIAEDTPEEQLLCELVSVYSQRHELWPTHICGEESVSLRLHDIRAQLVEFQRYLQAFGGKGERP